MAWIVLVGLGIVVLGLAYYWGNASDPKKNGTVGCCHCGACLTAGECVMVKRQKETAAR